VWNDESHKAGYTETPVPENNYPLTNGCLTCGNSCQEDGNKQTGECNNFRTERAIFFK
jgi:hypothetical protein